MRLHPVVALCALLAALAAPAAAVAAGPPVPQLPDMAEEVPTNVGISTVGPSSDRQFRLIFASGAKNVGAGPLEIDGSRPDTSVPMSATQQLFGPGHVPAGSPIALPEPIVYNDLFGHQHFHFLAFQHYTLLRASDGAQEGLDQKQGFCLGDSRAVVASPPPPLYPGGTYDSWCKQNQPDALSVSMGITPGYEDIYSPAKEGQFIDVTDTPPGDYVLVNRANPDGTVQESDMSNNASSALVRLSRPYGMTSPPAVTVLRTCPGSATCDGPAAVTGPVSGVTPTGATLNGSVTPNGPGATAHFEYGLGSAAPSVTPDQALAAGSAPLPVSASVQGLAPSTTYTYRMVAVMGPGAFYGGDRSFTTAPLPLQQAALPQSPLGPRPRRGFVLRRVRPLKGGRVSLRMFVPGAGRLVLRPRGSRSVHALRRRVRVAGAVTVVLQPTNLTRTALARDQRLPVGVTATFRPLHGRARVLHLELSLLG